MRNLPVTKNQSRGAKRRVSQNKSPLLQSQIPVFQSDAVQSLKVRIYNVSTTEIKDLTFELPVPPYGYSLSTTSLAMPFKAVRMKSIELWCNYSPGVGVARNTINVSVLDRRTVRPIEWSDTATFLQPAHIKKKFSKDEPLGFWYQTTVGESNPEFTLQIPPEGVLEITYDYILSDNGSVATYASSSLTSNRIYTNNISSDFSCIGKAYVKPIS